MSEVLDSFQNVEPTLNQIARSLNELAIIEGRTDGYCMNTVRFVKKMILTKRHHPLRLWVEDSAQYKRLYLMRRELR